VESAIHCIALPINNALIPILAGDAGYWNTVPAAMRAWSLIALATRAMTN